MASINQAHLIHDHSSGHSSTRIHAPPGGKSSMGTSFGWEEEAPVQKHVQRRDPNASSVFGGPDNAQEQRSTGFRRNKNEFVDNRIGSGIPGFGAGAENRNTTQQSTQQQQAQQGPRAGFGDTGASSVKVHHAPGGASSGNIIGGWN